MTMIAPVIAMFVQFSATFGVFVDNFQLHGMLGGKKRLGSKLEGHHELGSSASISSP